jgi:hypothetical protein
VLEKLGGVRSQIRTGLDPELPDKWPFTGYFRELLPVIGKRAGIRCGNSMACERIPWETEQAVFSLYQRAIF